MIIAAPDTTHDLGEAVTNVAADALVSLLTELGPQGVAVLLAVGALVLTCKSKTFRKAEAAAFAWACRCTWRLLAALVRLTVDRIRHRRPNGPTPTKEERRILARLQVKHWREHADGRGLADTLPGKARLTDAGIVAAVRCTGTMTPGKLRKAEDNIRALLGLRAELRLAVRARTGDWAEVRIATRSAADTIDSRWTGDAAGIGVDTVTGRTVEIPLDARLLVAGASGSGKSWSLRPLMAKAQLADGAHLVFIDGKGEEADGPWAGICRTAVEPEEIAAVVRELHREMNRRRVEMKRRGISVWDGDTIYVVVDEGRVVLALDDKEMTQQLIDISALGRSRRVVLCWATQYPVTSGNAPGVHPQIAANTDAKFSLRVKNLTHAQVALDDDADYGPHLIAREQKGHGYLGGHGPHVIRTWAMTDADVKALPVDVWRAADDDQEPTVTLPVVLQKPRPGGGSGQPHAREAEPVPAVPEHAALGALLRADGDGIPVAAIQQVTGLGKSQAYALVGRLVEAGKAVKVKHGRYVAAGAVEGGAAA